MRGDGVELAWGHGEEAWESEAVVGARGGVEDGDGAGGNIVIISVVAGFAGAAGDGGGEGEGAEEGKAEED